MDETYQGLNCVTGISDDVLVAGSTPQEHLDNLCATFERARKHGQRYNLDKCEFNMPQISYYGHQISSEGIKPDPKKVEVITKMKSPTSKNELQTVLGMANYLAKFVPHLSGITAPLHDLLKDSSEFLWDAQQEKALHQAQASHHYKPYACIY